MISNFDDGPDLKTTKNIVWSLDLNYNFVLATDITEQNSILLLWADSRE